MKSRCRPLGIENRPSAIIEAPERSHLPNQRTRAMGRWSCAKGCSLVSASNARTFRCRGLRLCPAASRPTASPPSWLHRPSHTRSARALPARSKPAGPLKFSPTGSDPHSRATAALDIILLVGNRLPRANRFLPSPAPFRTKRLRARPPDCNPPEIATSPPKCSRTRSKRPILGNDGYPSRT